MWCDNITLSNEKVTRFFSWIKFVKISNFRSVLFSLRLLMQLRKTQFISFTGSPIEYFHLNFVKPAHFAQFSYFSEALLRYYSIHAQNCPKHRWHFYMEKLMQHVEVPIVKQPRQDESVDERRMITLCRSISFSFASQTLSKLYLPH